MHKYLALGDSYTIGEGVSAETSFPYQLQHLLNGTGNRAADLQQGFAVPRIIAKTGWTTDELDAAIDAAGINENYDLVTLLIGVNNQYRGRSSSEYKVQFDHLLQRALSFAGGKATHVIVLSIPDWGVTTFAEGQDRKKIAAAIDTFNATAAAVCEQHRVSFIDITSSQRADGAKLEYLAADGLHPSQKEYAKWSIKLFHTIKKNTIHE